MELMTAEEKRKQLEEWHREDEEWQIKEQARRSEKQLTEVIRKIENSINPEGITIDDILTPENIKKLEEAGYIVKIGANANRKKCTWIAWNKPKPNLLKKIKEAWIRLIIKL